MLCGGGPWYSTASSPAIFATIEWQLAQSLTAMAAVRLRSLQLHLLEASALNTLGTILDLINLRRALPLVTNIRVGIAISALVSPNRHEPLNELGDVLFDNVGRLLRELPSVISAARVPRQFEFLCLKLPV